MPKTVAAFDHLGESFALGEFVHEDHELVALAPHLFEQPEPDPEPDPDAEPVRIRGPLINPPNPLEESEPVDPPQFPKPTTPKGSRTNTQKAS